MNATVHSNRAATLIELLVGISTLGILLGVLVPAFSQSRGVSHRQAELGNLRTIINLAHTYAERDPKNILGPVHPAALLFRFEGYVEYGGGPGDMRFVGWDQQFDPRTRPFNQLLYGPDNPNPETAPGDRSVFKEFQCLGQDLGWQFWPGFASDPRETERSYFKANGTSFRQNNLTFDNGLFGIYAHSAQDIPAPSQTVAYMEARAYQTLWTNEVWGQLGAGGLAEFFGELVGNHKKRGFFMVSYADGHAGFVDFGFGTYFEQQDAGNRDVRGTWGRMDTLPIPASSNLRGAGLGQTANVEFNVSLVQED